MEAENHKIEITVKVNGKTQYHRATRSTQLPLPNLVEHIKTKAGELAAFICKDLGYMDTGLEIQAVPLETSQSANVGESPPTGAIETNVPDVPEKPVVKAKPQAKPPTAKKPVKPGSYKRKKK